ncbi:MAG: Rpn family recombination-promoting nuclease/putative transposase [Puniceicoccales bacterium]|jgi:hypothetical protein|nr:Rpn family recombination-promoting nuclease/putative transposase [Puniceicoccales bacterium]
MDFHAKTQGRDSVIIEMQARRHIMFDERALYYAAYTYSHQLSEATSGRPDWYEGLKPVYAIQFLDYDTQRIRGIQPRKGEEDLNQLFLQEVQAHPMPEDAFMKYYVMVDRLSGQEVKRGIHLIQIELPRVTRIRGLSPGQSGFVAKSRDLGLFLLTHFAISAVPQSKTSALSPETHMVKFACPTLKTFNSTAPVAKHIFRNNQKKKYPNSNLLFLILLII